MKRRAPWIVVVACAAWSSAGTPNSSPPSRPAPAEVAAVRTVEVKLRKLYLVRPDLISYPVPYDVVC